MSAPAPRPRLVIVDGVPMSALIAESAEPKAVIVAIHGGGTTSVYFDCPGHPSYSLLRSGAAAEFTVVALDRPGYGSSAPYPEAVGTQIIERIDWDQSTLTHEPQVLGQAAHMWTRTSLRPNDVDVAELYDGFTMNCLSWIEALGFCGIGEAKEFLDGGKNIARDGQLPLNTHGGQLSHGRTHGMGLLHEAVSQLRGEAGDRQVAGARVGVVSSGGLTPSGVLLLRADG